MRITPLLYLAVIAAATACTEPSAPASPPLTQPQYITNGVPTGSDFGAVGALLFDFGADGSLDGLCTGGLISPTVFLTAAHCFLSLPPIVQLYVTFDPALSLPPGPLIAVEGFHVHPDFRLGGLAITVNDLGVVILPEGAAAGVTPLQLPPADHLDQLAANGGLSGELFLNVGYGVSASSQGPRSFSFDGVRKVSKSPFKALTSDWLGLLMNSHATGEGGICLGDSGGPKFLDGNPTMVVAVTAWVDNMCRASNFNQRVDTQAARAFLGQFVSLP
jgi:trypsin